MHHGLVHAHHHLSSWNHMWSEVILSVVLALLMFVTPASAAMRFQERSLYMDSVVPGDTTSYTVSWRYMSPTPVGSVDMLFCIDPIPYHECVTPEGLDVSNAVLSEQTGEVGFSILSKSTNHIVLTRPAAAPTTSGSTYKFDNIVNPNDTAKSFSIRLKSHSSPDATGAQIDFGSVKGQVTDAITLQTQVPPILDFCVAEEVSEYCYGTNEIYYKDLGILDDDQTLVAQSEMSIGTNASDGYVVTVHGELPAAGTNVIEAPSEPVQSKVGINQFGINLTANDNPQVGKNPTGPWTNAVAEPEYSIPNHYKYVPGDVVASAPNVSLMKKFTVSYILNSSPDLRPGVYTTTITFVASGRF